MKGDKRECSPNVHSRAPETKIYGNLLPLPPNGSLILLEPQERAKTSWLDTKTDAVTVHWASILMTFSEDKAALGYFSTHSSHHHQSMFTQKYIVGK